jgi:hypothetical protein
MKYLYLLSLSISLVFFRGNIVNAQGNLLSRIDTNIVINYNGEPLRYHQYIDMLKSGDFQMVTWLNMDHRGVSREIRKYTPEQKKIMITDKTSIDKRIAQWFGIQEKLPLSKVDTTIIVYNQDGKPLAYYQYAPLVLNKKFIIVNEKGRRYLRSRSLFMMRPAGSDSTLFNEMALMGHDDSVSINNSLYWWLMKADRIRVEKSKRKMYVERNDKVIFEFPINLGSHPIGAKQKEGDGRTPEGSYFIDYNINSKAAYYWGFHISYPNEQDKINADKLHIIPGKDIMIHGTSPQRSKLKTGQMAV